MASPAPRHIPAAGSDTGNKENICEDGGALLDCPAVLTEGPSYAKRKKKPAGFNLRKSIAWNPAFFTEDGVLDNSELSVLTGSQLMANGSPSSGVSGIMSPACRPGRYGNTCLPKEIAIKSSGKLTAKCRSTENQGRKLFSSAKTSIRDERKESAGAQSSSARSIPKCIPRVPAGSTYPYQVLGRSGQALCFILQNSWVDYTPKKVQNIASTTQMPRTPKKSSLPTVPRSTPPVTTVSKSNKKLASVNSEQIHRIPGLPPKPRVNSISSGPTPEKGVPAVAAKCDEANGSAKCKSFQPHQQISPSSSVGGTALTFAKPSALRAPSPSIGFFSQEKAHVSHDAAAKRNLGRCFAGNISSLVKPPKYKQLEDLKGGLHLTKPLSTNHTTASNLLVLPVTRESNRNTLVGSEKESLSKVSTPYSAKSANANNKERPEADCLLAGSGATTQPSSSEKNGGARNGVPIVHKDEGRDFTKEIEPTENSCSLKAICPSTIEPVADSCLFKVICSSDKPIVGSKLSPSRISSEVHTPNDLNVQSKSDSGLRAAIDLENSYVGKTAPAVSLSEGDGCIPGPELLRDFDSCDNQNNEVSTLMESVESTICADQEPCCSSSRDETPALADCNSDLNDSLCNEAKPTSTEEPNTDSDMELETNDALSLKEAPLLHVVCEHNHNFRSTECSPMKPEAPPTCVERLHVSSVDLNMGEKMVIDTNKLSALESASHIKKNKAVDRPRTNTILKDHLKHLVPFTEEWLAVMEACGQGVLEQKTGAVQNSPPDKTAPEPSPWSPVKRKAQDVGPFDCTKYSKIV
ncbi:hypothetical protein ACP70R_046982 [Stipagrostis hirtigluma subsp. patula]